MPLTQVSSRGIEDTLRYVLGASGTDHYTFTGKGLTGAVNDPTLTLSKGHTYIFENRSGGHPFYIKTSIANGGTQDAYNTGVTNNGGGDGTEIVFTVPHDAPDVLYYQCSSHSSMAGELKIAGSVGDGSITTAKLNDSAVTTAKLGADAVDGTKIADDAIDSEHFVDGSIDTAHIADNAITGDKVSDNLDIPDNNKIRFGTGNDLSIYHDGTNSTINNNTGDLFIQTDGNLKLEKKDGGSDYIHCIDGGGVEIHHNGNVKLETTSTGGLVTGFLKTSSPVAWYGEQDTHHTVANNTWTTIKNLGSHPANTDGWSESTGVFTVPSGKEGLYFLTVGAGIDDVQSRDFIYVGFAVNGTSPFIQQWGKQTYASENATIVANMTGMIYLSAGQTVRGGVKHNEGTTEYTEQGNTWFGGFRIT